jgi:D-serine deaminase-like pyridoxal phosphate-dependent protein
MPMSAADAVLDALDLSGPTLLVDERRARRNIERMAARAADAGLRLRPHFKTHQSVAVATWLRDAGVKEATVSSPAMAARFAEAGWQDLVLAFPLDPRALGGLRNLADRVRLGVVVDCPEASTALAGDGGRLRPWLKVDVGYGRAGVRWDAPDALVAALEPLRASGPRPVGLLTHAGHSYHADDADAVRRIHVEQCERLQIAREVLDAAGWDGLELSVGDTPCCTLGEDFTGIDEMRPGNFVFHDLQQVALGVCTLDDIAVAVACPVVGRDPERGRALVHGGAVHLSRDRVLWRGAEVHGLHAPDWPTGPGGLPAGAAEGAVLAGLSQEHGVLRGAANRLPPWGGVAILLPPHSCLAADLHGGYLTLEGKRLDGRSR